MTTRRNAEWTEADHLILRQMLAANASMADIARTLKRVQTDVASKAFAMRKR